MTVRRHRLAERRRVQGFTQESLAEALGVDASTVRRWERGTTDPLPYVRPKLAETLEIPLADLDRLLDNQPPRAASTAEVVTSDADDEWQRMSDLLRRTFLKRGIALTLPALGLDELRHIAAALSDARRYSDTAIVEYFSRSLQGCAESDRSRGPRQIIPVVLGQIAAIEQIAAEAQPKIRRELLRVGARTAEFAGWLYRDSTMIELAVYWHDRAVEWAQAANDLPMQGYILLKKSQAAWDSRDGLRMLTLAEAAEEGLWNLPPRVRAEAVQQVARGHAMLGADAHVVQRHVGRARKLLDQADTQTPALSPHYDQALFEVQIAHTFTLTGAPERALAIYEQWLSPQVFGRRDYGYRLAFKATTQAETGNVDSAAATAVESLAIARETDSARTHSALVRLVGELRPHWQRPAVRDLRNAMFV